MTARTSPRGMRDVRAMLDELAVIAHEVDALASGAAESVPSSVATIRQAAHMLTILVDDDMTSPYLTRIEGVLVEPWAARRAHLARLDGDRS